LLLFYFILQNIYLCFIFLNFKTLASSRSQHAGVENAEALPNPWSRVVNQPSQQNTTTAGVTATSGGTSGANPFGIFCFY
jgi:hypothetical protein